MILFKSLPFLDDTDPNALGSIILLDTNLAEDGTTPAWNSATTYTAGQIVHVAATHRRYEAIIGSTNKFPPDNLGVEWIDIGSTNRFRAFDRSVQSQTVADDASEGIYYRFKPNSLFTAMAFFNLNAGRIRILASEPGDDLVVSTDTNGDPILDTNGELIVANAVYDEFFDLLDRSVLVDWFEYFFAENEARDQLLVTDFSAFAGCNVIVQITGGAPAAVGEIAAGKLQNVGQTAWGGSIESLDFSRVEEDPFGNVTILRRGSAKRVEFPVMWPSGDTRRIDRVLDNVRSEPAVFAANTCDDVYGFFVYGFYQTYVINVSGPALSYATIEVRSLI
jgi:hypothetical protein